MYAVLCAERGRFPQRSYLQDGFFASAPTAPLKWLASLRGSDTPAGAAAILSSDSTRQPWGAHCDYSLQINVEVTLMLQHARGLARGFAV